MVSTLAAGGVTVEYVIFSVYKRLKEHYDQLEAMKVTAGLNEYVQLARGNPAYDVVAAINTVTAAISAANTWIDTNASGLNLTGDSAANAIANDSVASNRFSAAQTLALRNLLTAVTDAIGAA